MNGDDLWVGNAILRLFFYSLCIKAESRITSAVFSRTKSKKFFVVGRREGQASSPPDPPRENFDTANILPNLMWFLKRRRKRMPFSATFCFDGEYKSIGRGEQGNYCQWGWGCTPTTTPTRENPDRIGMDFFQGGWVSQFFSSDQQIR